MLFTANSGAGAVPIDSMNLGGSFLLPGDTTAFATTHSFLSTRYAPGNNVVVIWPINSGGEAGDSLAINVYVVYPNAINEVNLSDYLNVYPNPFSNEIRIENLLEEENLNYKIYTISGSLVSSGVVNETTINVAHLPSGSYSLHVYSDQLKANIILIKP